MKTATGAIFTLTNFECLEKKIAGYTYYLHKTSEPECLSYTMVDTDFNEYSGVCSFAELLIAIQMDEQINVIQETLGVMNIIFHRL